MFRITLRLLIHFVFAAAVVVATTAVHAAQECGFLPTSEVDQAFAEFAPWHTEVGGAVGHCLFLSNEGAPPNMLSFMQQFKTSKADADKIYNAMRKGFADSGAVTEVAGFGDRAFRFGPGSDVNIVAQKDKLVVTMTLHLQREVTEADIKAMAKLGQLALRGANDPETVRKASACPWFNEAGLKKIFGGKPYEVQVYGENGCMAVDKQKRALMVSVIERNNGLTIDSLLSPDCEQRDLPELGLSNGKNAKLSFSCKSGSLRAAVNFAENKRVYRLIWVTAGVEPSDAEKAALIELAKHMRSVGR
ncbi:MAG: hypothetical protein FWF41_02340 [Betaproteobacteria bacterium]|nr:hypothetical protein [Betaproteobacteria bacterium]